MRKINWFYVSVIVLIPLLSWLLWPENEADIAFYGFAENLETEINYNYDVMVERIMVSPGQHVEEGVTLLQISRRKSKEVLEDQIFQIRTLESEEMAWKQKKVNELAALKLERDRELSSYDHKISRLENEIAFRRSLVEPARLNDSLVQNFSPLSMQLKQLSVEKESQEKRFSQDIDAIEEEIRLGLSPFRNRIAELKAEREFDAAHKVQFIEVKAPTEGLIGNIYCKEAEHVPAFKTLLTFYEPHSGIIKGYVHEDLTMTVRIGDKFLVSSLKDETISYEGTVIGLGSRIVEIPERLRKFPQIKTYGREVTLEIPETNIFLQKEKVGLQIKIAE